MPLTDTSYAVLQVERAAHDLRKGFPVIIRGDAEAMLIMSPETVAPEVLQSLPESLSFNTIITSNRLKYIANVKKFTGNQSLPVQLNDTATIATLSGMSEAKGITIPTSRAASALENAALQLVRIAELLPSAVTAQLPASFDDRQFLSVPAAAVAAYDDTVSCQLHEACRTPLILRHNIQAEIIAYRPTIGGKEHYAIIIGQPGDTPLVRVHSSCYTGDLLDSLACDCHDQLHSAIDLMQQGGGIILYMLQEGRGIGLINKLRAYAMKERGLDTVDANEALGFDDDERLFQPAATMLENMGIRHIRLLTNNPKKAAGLEEFGITVRECVPHIMQSNVHNEQYLQTKSERLGHRMDEGK